MAEEQFGPALPVIPYDSEAEAVALANQTWSGLCSSVWSADTEHAMKIAGQLRTGVTFFNNHNATAVDERAPFGGFNPRPPRTRRPNRDPLAVLLNPLPHHNFPAPPPPGVSH